MFKKITSKIIKTYKTFNKFFIILFFLLLSFSLYKDILIKTKSLWGRKTTTIKPKKKSDLNTSTKSNKPEAPAPLEPKTWHFGEALEDYLPPDYQNTLENHPNKESVKVIAIASFPANDMAPHLGNGIAFFHHQRNQKKQFTLHADKNGKKVFPLKVAARPYKGRHTGYRYAFLESPVGVFSMHKGSRNGSRHVSWGPAAPKNHGSC